MSVFIGAVKGANKGTNKIAKKVEEVNALIEEADNLDAVVFDPSSTWQGQYKFEPYYYKRGVLYEAYSTFSNIGWRGTSDTYPSSEAMSVLNTTAKWLRSAIRREKKYL